VIPVDQLSEIEVTKVLMPEMDGDAIGGTVNLVTPGALDTHMVFKALLAGGENDLSGKPLWQGSAALSRRFLKDGALGVYLGGSWFRNETRTDGLEMTWDTTEGNRGVVWNLEQREYHNEKERTGASGRLDWRTPGGSIAYLTGNWSQTDDSQLRDRFTITREGANQISPAVPDSFFGDGIHYTREVRYQERVENVSQATLGGNTQTGPVVFDLSGTGSASSMHQDPNLLVDFGNKLHLYSYIDPGDPDVPSFYAFNYPNPKTINPLSNEASNFVLGGVQSVAKDGEENDLHGRADARLSLGEDSSWEIRAGGKWGWNHKDQEVSGGSMATTKGTPQLFLNQVLSSDSGVGFYDGHYTIGPLPDLNAVKAWLAANGSKLDTTASSNDHIQNDPEDYSVVEYHWAGYAETKWHLGDFSAVGGLRLERYEISSTGNYVAEQSDESWSYTLPVTVDRTFDFLLPMVSARWSPIPELVGRASYTRSFSLPDAMDLLPTTEVDLLDLTEKVGNPDLKATLADAVELDLEWYRKPRGMASIGVFGKRLTDYVFPVVWEQWDVMRKAGFTYYSKANGDAAYLEGVELEMQQPFNFLPSYLSGLGFDGNYTWTHSSTTLPGRTGESTLPGQSEHSGNVGLRFDLQGFTAQVSANFQSPFLYQVSDETDNDIWVDWHKRLDLAFSQRMSHGLLVYFQVANLTNTPYRMYMGDTNHPTQIEYNGRTFEGGLRISL
jgi:TonB-dependent receptor